MANLETETKVFQFRELFRNNYPQVKKFAWQLLKSEEDADDIAQDIFTKLWERPDLWENCTNLNGYLFMMTKNNCLNLIKHRAMVCSTVDAANDIIDLEKYGGATAHNECELNELQLLIEMTIEQMPEKRKLIFKMSREEDMSHQEIANRLGLSVRTVEQHIYKALQDLKKVILLSIVYFLYA